MSSKTKTTATKEAPTPALVPKLRYPEFRGAEGWKGGGGSRHAPGRQEVGLVKGVGPVGRPCGQPQSMLIEHCSEAGGIQNAISPEFELVGCGLRQARAGFIAQCAKALAK